MIPSNKSEENPVKNTSTSHIKRGSISNVSLTQEELSMSNKRNRNIEIQQQEPPTPNQTLPNNPIQSYSDINAESVKKSTLTAIPKRTQQEKEKQRKNSFQSRDNIIDKLDTEQLNGEDTAPYLGTIALNAETVSTYTKIDGKKEPWSSSESESDSGSSDSSSSSESEITNTPNDMNTDMSANTSNLCSSTKTTIPMEKLFDREQSTFEGKYTPVENENKTNVSEENGDDSSSDESEDSNSDSDEEGKHFQKQADLFEQIALRRKEKEEKDIHLQQLAEELAIENQQITDKKKPKDS
jgi:hypothetical protein